LYIQSDAARPDEYNDVTLVSGNDLN